MDLGHIDIGSLKAKKGKEREEIIAQYEKEKVNLINDFLHLQDLVDEYNERIYVITCNIEKINLILKEIS